MTKARKLALAAALLVCAGAQAVEPEQLYRATAIVTGRDERNRPLGFRECLDEVLVRVSGDARLIEKPEMAGLRERAGRFVSSFSYRDRMEGIPVHDEQGTYDRPYDLTCIYEPAVVDELLASLGGRPWLGERPTLAVLLRVEQGAKRFTLTADGREGDYMRQAFEAVAETLAMEVAFPSGRELAGAQAAEEGADAASAAAWPAGHARLLQGGIVWSDAERGWVADWRLWDKDVAHHWEVRGVSFDEAFRGAVRGSAQILSGNGPP